MTAKKLPGVTQLELAGILGLDRNTLAAWTRAGMPVARRGRGSRGHEYDVGACVRWARQRDRELHERALAAAKAASPGQAARARKWTADAQRSELESQRQAGELLDRADVGRTWTQHITDAKTLLEALPAAVAPRCAHRAPGEVESLLRAEITTALRVLAGPAA